MGTHFEDKPVKEHLKAARIKGMVAAAEVHGAETPGALSAGIDACQDTLFLFLLLWILELSSPGHTYPSLFLALGAGWIIWKTGRSALLGWRRINRLHKLIEEERWEVEHHRGQEKQELTALYAAKGFQGKLLEDVIEVLMADDDRLLKVMLEEELGLTLEVYEHPLKQSVGAFIGSLLSTTLLFTAYSFFPKMGIPIVATCLLALTASFLSKKETNAILSTLIWTLAVAGLTLLSAHFIFELIT